MKGKKRLSSLYAKYSLFLMLASGVVGLVIALVAGTFIPIGIIAIFMILAMLFLMSIFSEVYYDNEYIYIKKFYRKEFRKFGLNEIEEIDHKVYMGLDIIVINGDNYYFSVRIWLRFKKDLLAYIRK